VEHRQPLLFSGFEAALPQTSLDLLDTPTHTRAHLLDEELFAISSCLLKGERERGKGEGGGTTFTTFYHLHFTTPTFTIYGGHYSTLTFAMAFAMTFAMAFTMAFATWA
jgi:hypothetical protein